MFIFLIRKIQKHTHHTMTEKEIVKIFNSITSFDKSYIYRNPKLSFGAFISTLNLINKKFKYISICADDFGITKKVNHAIAHLAELEKISRLVVYL